MVTQLKRIFIGFSILWLAIACQNTPVAPVTTPTSNIAQTMTSIVQTLTALATPALVGTNTDIAMTNAEAIPASTEGIPTFSLTVVDTPTPRKPVTGSTPPTVGAPQQSLPQSGSIRGIVLLQKGDAEGVAVDGITVVVSAGPTQKTMQTKKSEGGAYLVLDIPAGFVFIDFYYGTSTHLTVPNVIVNAGQETVLDRIFLLASIPDGGLPQSCRVFNCGGFPTLVKQVP
jgi:hypothetical protein